MNDNEVLNRIEELVDQEHHLLEQRGRGELARDGHAQLEKLQVNLDQCWDLLRRRRALRSAGADPDLAEVRPGPTVEHYQQ